MSISITVYIALLGWPLLMVAAAFFFPARAVVMASIIGGNLFLPVVGLMMTGIPNYTRAFASGLGALLVALIFLAPQLLSWRPKPLDLVFFCFIISPSISSLLNGLGAWDAASVGVYRVLEWGVAYWVGRSLFQGERAIRELAIGIVVGGLVYAPLCVWEAVMSPQLNRQIYGFTASPFIMNKRFGGWRPTVFMPHGLAVAVWMAATAPVAWVLWRSRAVAKIWIFPMWLVAVGLIAVTILLRSAGAVILLLGMIAAVEFVQASRVRVTLLAVLLLPVSYVGLRLLGWNADLLVRLVSALGEEKVGSLVMRIENDALIVQRALQRPIFGWGGWGRWRVFDEFGNDITISDSWWGILVGTTGIFGLAATYGTFVAPMFLLIRQKVRDRIFEPVNGSAWAIGMALLLFVLDSLANAMPNATFMMAAGALASYVLLPRGRSPAVLAPAGTLERVPPARVQGHPRPIDLR